VQLPKEGESPQGGSQADLRATREGSLDIQEADMPNGHKVRRWRPAPWAGR